MAVLVLLVPVLVLLVPVLAGPVAVGSEGQSASDGAASPAGGCPKGRRCTRRQR